MIEKLQHKYALSKQGAKDMIKACVCVTISDIVLMGPACILYLLIRDLLDHTLDSSRIGGYVVGIIVVLLLIAFTQYQQYNATFLSTYKESGVRRITIAERMRKLPLSYFGKKNLSDLTTNIIVFQNVTLFNTTVMENIRLGKKDATDEEVIRAAKMANCEEFISCLPNGYQTQIGENGCNLSGGERQRISIARAFLKDAPIILLDEATASLDVENETLIQEALSGLIKDKTVLIIAHRMRTIANADHIVVLKDGVVAESGTPDELMAQDGIYRHMTELQNISRSWKIA